MMSEVLARGSVLRTWLLVTITAAATVGSSLATAGPAAAASTPPPLVAPGGDLVTFDVVTPGEPVSVQFDGVRGQIPTVQVVTSSLTGPATLSLTSGQRSLGALAFAGPAFKVYPALPSSGRWSLVLAPGSTDTGQITLVLEWATGAPQRLSPGSVTRVRITDPSKVQVFAIPVVVGRRPTLTVQAANLVSTGGATEFPNASASLFRPDGSS